MAVASKCQEQGISYEDVRAYVSLADGATIRASRKGIGLGPGFQVT